MSSSSSTTETNLERIVDSVESSITKQDSESSEILQIATEDNKVFSGNSDENMFEKSKEEGAHSSSNSDPETIKRRGYRVGVKSDCNVFYRRTMEDSHTIVEDYMGVVGQGFFAIYDGHGGKMASEYCSENYHKILETLINEDKNMTVPTVVERMAAACAKTDFELQQRMANTHFGSTAIISYLYVDPKSIGSDHLEKYLITVNVGDARAVICRDGKAIRLSTDHNAMHNKPDCDRIREMGGFVAMGRVNGLLAVTRSFGDFYLKPYVSVKPFSSSLKIGKTDKFIILACDGLWDVCEDQKAVDLIMTESDPEVAAQTLLQYALDNNSTDNLSVMVVILQH